MYYNIDGAYHSFCFVSFGRKIEFVGYMYAECGTYFDKLRPIRYTTSCSSKRRLEVKERKASSLAVAATSRRLSFPILFCFAAPQDPLVHAPFPERSEPDHTLLPEGVNS